MPAFFSMPVPAGLVACRCGEMAGIDSGRMIDEGDMSRKRGHSLAGTFLMACTMSIQVINTV